MIYGEQWRCDCGFANSFVRKRCRNCEKDRAPDAPVESIGEALDNCRAENASGGLDQRAQRKGEAR